MNSKLYRKLVLALFVVFTIGMLSVPIEVAAYYEWYEYHTYTADDYKYETGEDPFVFWLHSEATIRFKYREDYRGRIRLNSSTWYKVEHTMQMKPIDGSWWLSCNGVASMYILRGSTQLWTWGDWTWHHVAYPGIAFQSGDQFRDYSTSGAYGTLENVITIN